MSPAFYAGVFAGMLVGAVATLSTLFFVSLADESRREA